ncbi:TetR/AcrR family transcriptional regulator [Rhodoferax aquaticus]|uniref:TetR/AcrR family transcriptional regulator n=1 Tax=Rhodoferax aquaticus TaxID=2527691 RepID=A0A515EKY8_9BURK|nr:TetR/AcrR family transcriptional regulator [Rhodoferax aquaticus]QDL53327.1 TetR/AcrR family transcriptional regulator [Rhodoferax aquaticus]
MPRSETPPMPSALLADANVATLNTKAQPRQKRAQETYELILGATAQLLAEVGIERLSTNLVCERAGISPPALYRYFPNKYALLGALGTRLMQEQNALVEVWATPATLVLDEAGLKASIYALYAQTLDLTRAMPEGLWVTRALRAVPTLAPIRIASHAHVAGLIVHAFMSAHPHAQINRVRTLARLSVEMVYAALEMLFDDPSQDEHATGEALAEMLARQVVLVRQTRSA